MIGDLLLVPKDLAPLNNLDKLKWKVKQTLVYIFSICRPILKICDYFLQFKNTAH